MAFTIQQCAIPAVTFLICLIAYPSQWLLRRLGPHPLTTQQSIILHVYALVILFCYYKACFTDPGRIPKDWIPKKSETVKEKNIQDGRQRQRWCRKCQAYKPPRAHHCKTCLIHVSSSAAFSLLSPWTANCVSHTTFPHFVRFLFYAVAGMSHLGCLLWSRMYHLWTQRDLPSYLGPSPGLLFGLFFITALNSVVVFALFILLVRTLWCLGANTTTIEGWEIERHETLLRRARYLGGVLEGPNGTKIPITRQEYPWDIGIFSNIAQGMGSWNPLAWFWPFSFTPSVGSGLEFEDNGLEAPGTTWPPPDPDRMFRIAPTERAFDPSNAFTHSMDPEEVYKRQQADRMRPSPATDTSELRRRQPFHVRYDKKNVQKRPNEDYAYGTDYESDREEQEHEADDWQPKPGEGEEGWRNSEGERLNDFGVDEDIEFYDEDEVPLSELMKRKNLANNGSTY
ncbi:zf-DHHC-domain-containing protein [Aureobasidium sp. EXF-3400]|nr:zf-DHHC-domain-containing protein [Aureobasidium sp. EXF-12344]KAI4771773.1 zf-DHHC-domain-containing protein [Aureobasidium sp. EXF-3400]